MTSGEERKVDYLRISVTDLCNFRCLYCMPPEGVRKLGHREILTFEEINRVARAALGIGINRIRLTGGEPLIRKGVIRLIEELGKLPGIRDLSLTTNGSLLSRFAGSLRRAGVRRLNVSLDSVNPLTFRRITRGGDLAPVLAGIRAAKEAGFVEIKLNTVVLRGINDEEIFDLLEFAGREGLAIRWIELMPLGSEMIEGESRFVPLTEIKRRILERMPLELVESHAGCGPAEYFRTEEGGLLIGFIAPISRCFCPSCNRLRLTAEGKLRPCLASDWEVDLRAVLRGGGSERALRDLLLQAIAGKPAAHRFDQGAEFKRKMVSIGG